MLVNFLKDIEKEKLKLLYYLLLADDYSKSHSETKSYMNLDTRALKRLCSSLNEDFLELKINISLNLDSSKIYLEIKKSENVNNSPNKLFSFYLNNSVTFNLFFDIFFLNTHNVIDLTLKEDISQSHCYLSIRKINKYLTPYNINIKTSQFVVNIDGNELNIVFFISSILNELCYLDIFNRYDYRIPGLFLNEVDYHVPDYKEKELTFLKIAFNIRANNSKNICISNLQVKEILLIIKSNFEDEEWNIGSCQSKYSHTYVDKELFTVIISKMYTTSKDEESIRRKTGADLSELHSNIIVNICKNFMDKINNIFFNNELESGSHEYSEFLYLLCLHCCYIDCLNSDPKLESRRLFLQEIVPIYSQENYATVKEMLYDLLNQTASSFIDWSQNTKNIFIYHMSDLVAAIIFSFQSPQLNILIHTMINFTDRLTLQKQMMNYFSNKMINFVDDYNSADIIISDEYINNPNDLPTYIIYDNFSNKLWMELLTFVLKEGHLKLVREKNSQFSKNYNMNKKNDSSIIENDM